jgi:CBS domain-containing protein
VRISGLLKVKGDAVFTVLPSATVAEVVMLLVRYGIGALVVSNDGVHIAGIVSERDVVRRLDVSKGAALDDRVSAVMSTEVRTCSPDDDIESLMETMTEHRVRHVPVVVDGALAGLVSMGDVVRSRIDELQRDRDELVQYIQAR